MPLHVILFAMLWLGACGYALVFGGAPERIMGGAFVAAALLSPLAQHWQHMGAQPFHHAEIGVLAVDVLLFGVTMWLALASTRRWSLAMASMQASIPIAHIANMIAPNRVATTYFAMVVFIAFPQLLLLAIATWRHRRRLRTIGIDYSWKSQLPAPYLQGATLTGLREAGLVGKDATSPAQPAFSSQAGLGPRTPFRRHGRDQRS